MIGVTDYISGLGTISNPKCCFFVGGGLLCKSCIGKCFTVQIFLFWGVFSCAKVAVFRGNYQ